MSGTGTIFYGSWLLFVRNIRLLLVSAVLLAVVYSAVVVVLSRSMNDGIGWMATNVGLSGERYEELTQRMEQGDPEATMELMRVMDVASQQYAQMSEEERNAFVQQKAKAIAERLSSYLVLLWISGVLLLFAGALLGLVILLRNHRRFNDVLRTCGILLLPMALTWIGVFLRSFVWLSFVGLLPGMQGLLPLFAFMGIAGGVWFGTRLLFAPVLLVSEGLRPRAALERSLQVSEGHWKQIVHSLIILGVSAGLLYALLRRAIHTAAGFSEVASVFLGGFMSQLILLLGIAFLVVLMRSLCAEGEQGRRMGGVGRKHP